MSEQHHCLSLNCAATVLFLQSNIQHNTCGSLPVGVDAADLPPGARRLIYWRISSLTLLHSPMWLHKANIVLGKQEVFTLQVLESHQSPAVLWLLQSKHLLGDCRARRGDVTHVGVFLRHQQPQILIVLMARNIYFFSSIFRNFLDWLYNQTDFLKKKRSSWFGNHTNCWRIFTMAEEPDEQNSFFLFVFKWTFSPTPSSIRDGF